MLRSFLVPQHDDDLAHLHLYLDDPDYARARADDAACAGRHDVELVERRRDDYGHVRRGRRHHHHYHRDCVRVSFSLVSRCREESSTLTTLLGNRPEDPTPVEEPSTPTADSSFSTTTTSTSSTTVSTSSAAAPTPTVRLVPGWSYQGCWRDLAFDGHVLPNDLTSKAAFTVESCLAAVRSVLLFSSRRA